MSNLFRDWDDLDRLWIGGVIPFEIDPSVDLAESDGVLRPFDAVLAAIDHWEANTPVRFVPRELEDVHWVTFILDDRAENCNSGLGRNRDRTEAGHRIEFPSSGCSEADLVHEIGHRIGLVHEHSRPDRDENIVIYRERFAEGWSGFVQNVMNLAGFPFGDYDFQSVMHYSSKGGGFIPYENSWDNGYDNATFFRRGGQTRCLLYTSESSIALFCDVLADGGIASEEDSDNGILAPRNIMLGERGWDQLCYLRIDGTDILLGTKRSTGELGTWMVDPDGMPITGSAGDIIDNPILGYPVQDIADYGVPDRRLVLLRQFDPVSLPARQKVEIVILKDSGRFNRLSGTPEVSSTSFTINGHWTDVFIPDSSDPFRWVLVNRARRLVSRVLVDITTGDFSSVQSWTFNEGVAKWDMIDVRFDGSDIIVIAHDDEGILEHFTLTPRLSRLSDREAGPSRNPLPRDELDLSPRVTLDDSINDTGAGHVSMSVYRADDGRRLILMNPGRNQSRAWFWRVEDDGFDGQLGEGIPRIERIQPVRESDIARLGGSVLSEGDISAADVLLRGNIEIRTGDPLDPLHRIGVAFIDQRVSDAAVIHIDGETILWVGDGRTGDSSLHTLDARGKPSGRWRTAASIQNWRTACLYQDPAGDDYFVLMRARNTGRVRRHAVTRDGVAANEIQTINTNRWDQMRTLRASDGRTFIGFVDRGRSRLEIRPVENGGGLGDPFGLDIGDNLDDVALLESEGNLFVFLTGENGVPELYLFVPGDRRGVFAQQNIGDEDSRADLIKSWNYLVLLGPDRIGIFDQPTGSMAAMSLKDITDFVTVRRYPIGDDWHTFESFENRNGGHMVINAQDGWDWR